MGNTLMTIPFCQLKRSKINIRKTDPLSDVEQLAASIEANGLLENLIVRREDNPDDGQPDSYEVVAGGRRLAALKLLLKRKRISRDHPVPCLALDREGSINLVEISLAENIVRAPVHPADQFEAFFRLQKDGLPAEDIAARFGLSPAVVLQRLKLAAVSPRLMAEYRSGKLTLEQMMAFTISDDHKAQEEFWFESPFGDLSPQAIRRFLTKSHVESGDRRARFVGAKAYEEAGGVVVRDLFQPEEEGYFTDSQLLDRLVAEKLQAEAETVKAEGWGWVECMLETDFNHLARLGRVKTIVVALSEEDEARLSAISERYDELVATIEEDGDENVAAEFDQVSAELAALQAKKEIWPEEEKSRAGAIIGIDYHGKPQIVLGLVKPEDRRVEEEPREQGERMENVSAKKEKSSNGYSEAVLVDLSAHRTAALREVLASQPDQALVALLHALVGRIFFNSSAKCCIEITPAIADLGKFSESVGESKAAAAMLARHNFWAERLPPIDELWDCLARMQISERLELLAYCTAITVDAVHRQWEGTGRSIQADQLARAISLDMTDWWQPTQSGFFDRVRKDQILKAVSEGVSKEAAHRISERKKSQMGHDAQMLLEGKDWLPEPLRISAAQLESMNETAAIAVAE